MKIDNKVNHYPVSSQLNFADWKRHSPWLTVDFWTLIISLDSLLSGSSDARQERLRSRHPFVPAARNLLYNLDGLDIRASEWTNYKCNAKYCENTSKLRVFIPRTGARRVGTSLP